MKYIHGIYVSVSLLDKGSENNSSAKGNHNLFGQHVKLKI